MSKLNYDGMLKFIDGDDLDDPVQFDNLVRLLPLNADTTIPVAFSGNAVGYLYCQSDGVVVAAMFEKASHSAGPPAVVSAALDMFAAALERYRGVEYSSEPTGKYKQFQAEMAKGSN